uniref:Piezo type mechanosensitive ion channel component 1 (Er blood group) n=1 Tax=Sinocyclocheilus grahami TaxID=75366 RepID=A0A672MF10_SINGR
MLSCSETEDEESPYSSSRAAQLAARLRATAQHFLRHMGRILAVTLLALAGITLPSAFSAFYFLLFIGVCTWWACHFPISHLGFNTLCVMVAFFTGGHLVCLYLYQSSFAQDMFSPAGLWARLFGLKAIIKPGNCSSFDININTQHDWPVYVNPGILFLLYISVTIGNVHCAFTLREDASSPLICMYISELVMFVCAGPSGEAAADNPLRLVGRMILQQSYICALIAMMVWSITYHSWLTFVLLLWSCLIWMLRARQRFATLCSPFILLYGFTLCCLQYVWAMDLETELPQHIGTMSLRQLGLDRLLFTLTFWLLLRQSVKDMFSRKKRITAPLQEVTTGGEREHQERQFCLVLCHFFDRSNLERTGKSTGRNESILKVFGGLVMSLYAKYWIYVCGGMFIMVSFAGKLVAYKIVYMLLFLLCLCLYQVYYSLWRRLLKAFWWMVVAYTMVVLIAIYTFQFEDFPGYWGNFTGFTEQQLTDMGLETFKLSELFTSIVIPGFFLLACILQLHYFHKPFMKITDLENVTPIHRHEKISLQSRVMIHQRSTVRVINAASVLVKLNKRNSKLNIGQYSYGCQHTPLILVCILFSEVIPSKWGLVMDRVMVLSRKFSDTLTHVQSFIWRVLELHIVKIVAYFVVWVALLEPSAMNLVLVVLWSFAMPYGRFRAMASCLSTIWVCVIIVCKMLYQLSVVNTAEYSNNCTVPMVNETSLELDEVLNSTLYKAPVDPANWFGVRKDATILGYTKDHLLVLMLLVFEATVYRHQIHHYRQQQRSPPPIPVIFPQATRDTLDKGLLPCIKYLLNYSFYKFGLEICFLMTVNVIGQRMNFLVIIHGCWLVAIMVQRRRAAIAKIWSKYCLFLVVFMIYQYVLCVGIPPALCIDYPWRWRTSVTIHSALVKWIYLPDFYTIPNSRNLISDFLLLMCASQQWAVFENEKKEEWMVMGGENKDNPDPMEDMPFNPAPNFINCRSYLDMAKVLVFRYMFWFVLSVLFVTGATRISVFGLGYLMACFFFLLFGTRLLIKPSRTRLVLWDCLIIYNVAVIISKNLLSILACVFVLEMQKNFCWVIQLFSLVCTVKGYYDRKFSSQATGSDIVQRILDILKFLWVLFLAMVDGFTMWLNLLTKQYVDTSMVLSEERYLFIHNISQVGNSPSREPMDDQISQDSENLTVETCLDEMDTDNVRFNSNVNYFLCMLYFRPFSVEELIQSGEFYSSQNRLLKLLFALYNVLAAHSELVCYFIIVLNNLVTASVISLVLPILVFLWAMLSVPRPSKRFWMTAIIYTEVMVVVKYLFQFGFFPWNTEYELKLNEDKPFFPPRILGLEKTDNYIRYDLLQLLVLFFHRSLLQGPLEEKSNLSSAEKNENERDEKVFQLSDEEDSRAQPEPDTEVLSMTPSTETPTDAEIQTDPEPNIQTDTTENLDAVKADGKKKSRFLRFRKKKLVKNVYTPTCGFFQNILHAEYRAATDVYALMFLTDVVDFIIIVFGFWAFGKHSAAADIASSLSEDQVPEAFLVMLLIQFSTMIIDRALYLRKSILGKLIFQVILVFGIHLWMFFILPAVTERMFNHNSVAQLWYFFKCIYFTLSAYQIRCGYPTRILGNFLTKKFNHLNLFLFQGFRLVPFLVELRAVMDWVWTDTTLSLSNWMCVEDIYANIFIIKCSRETEKKYPQPKGQKKKKIVKYGMGGLIILFLICIIWFPLLFISLVKSVVGVVNHPVDVTVTVRLGGYEPLFTMSVQQQSIQPFKEQSAFPLVSNTVMCPQVAMQFITMYSYEDIVTANIEGSSGSVWRISPPSRQELIKELLGSTGDMTLRLDWNFQRMWHNRVESTWNIYLKYRFVVFTVISIYKTYFVLAGDEEGYQDVTLSLMREASVNTTGAQEWWDISIADCRESCGVLPMVVFNDKVSPPSLGFLAGYGIMGLYVSVVLVIGKFVRGFFSEISHSIMFEELPCVDRILKLCMDIFLVRETGELELEEEIYSKLIFLYRSPETMIKWTREKNED